jgi:DNA-binding transcriptional MocR family regulator
MPLSQDELASLAGTSRATVARAFHDWRQHGFIQTSRRHITIVNVAGLRKIAGGLQLSIPDPPDEMTPAVREDHQHGTGLVVRIPHEHRHRGSRHFDTALRAGGAALAPCRHERVMGLS